MTPDIALTLSIIAVAVALFASEKLRVDVIALGVLLVLVITGLVTPEEGFSGFASTAVITVWAVYIVSGGMFRTGVADAIGQRILQHAGTSEPKLVAAIMATCGTMSGFINNIGATAVLLPAVASISRQTRVPVSKLLIPLSFASLMGGSLTMIGTPPNILANDILAGRGYDPLAFFAITPLGIVVFGTGIVFMVLVGRHLLPVREQPSESAEIQQLREYVSEINVLPESTLAGTSLEDARLGAEYDLTAVALLRDGDVVTSLTRDTRIEGGDILLVEGSLENLLRVRDEMGVVIGAERPVDIEDLSDDAHVVEATLAPRSPMVGRTLREMRFRDRYGFTALAIWRHGEVLRDRLRDVRFEFGDSLILRGPRDRLPALVEGDEFLVLEPVLLEQRRRAKAPLALGIMALVLFLVTVVGYHISTAMVIGAFLMVLTGCLTMDEAYESIEWRSVFLIAGMLPLGIAMESTGTAQFLADQVVALTGGLGPIGVLAGIYILSSLMTEPMSNAAATVLMVPIAIDTALTLGANPYAFVLAVVIGASTSFLTPVGHQANVLVFGPGGYRFFDYTRVGAPLNVALFLATMFALPRLFPLF